MNMFLLRLLSLIHYVLPLISLFSRLEDLVLPSLHRGTLSFLLLLFFSLVPASLLSFDPSSRSLFLPPPRFFRIYIIFSTSFSNLFSSSFFQLLL